MKNCLPYGIFKDLVPKPRIHRAYAAVCAMSIVWLVGGGPWAWQGADNVWVFALLSLIHGVCLTLLTFIGFMSGFGAGSHTVEYWKERARLAEKQLQIEKEEETKK